MNKLSGFVLLLFSLTRKLFKNIGVIHSFGSLGEIAKKGEPLSLDNLLNVLEHSRQEVKTGNVISN